MNGNKVKQFGSLSYRHMLTQSTKEHESSVADGKYYYFDLPKNSVVQEILFHNYTWRNEVNLSILVNGATTNSIKRYAIQPNVSHTINLSVTNGGVLQCHSGAVSGFITIWYYIKK